MGWTLAGNIKGPAGSGGGAASPIIPAGLPVSTITAAVAGVELQYAPSTTGYAATFDASQLTPGDVGLIRNTSGNVLTLTGAAPGVTNAGNTWLGFFYSGSTVTAAVVPSGWTVLDNTTSSCALAYHVTTSSEPPTIVLPTGMSAVIQHLTNDGASGKSTVAGYQLTTGSSLTSGAQNITLAGASGASAAYGVAMFMAASSSGTTFAVGAPAGWTNPAQLAANQATWARFLLSTPPTADVVLPVTYNAGFNYAGYVVAVPGSVIPGVACEGGGNSGLTLPLPGGALLVPGTKTMSAAGALATWRYDGGNTVYLNGEFDA